MTRCNGPRHSSGASVPADPWILRDVFGTFELTADGGFASSPELLRLLGFGPGEVVATEAALVAHVHPEDRARWREALEAARTTGQPMVLWHRLNTAQGQERTVVTTLTTRAQDGTGTGVKGSLTDLSEPFRGATAARVSDAVDRASATRAPIDQAKGILMAVLDLDDEQAFDLLRWHSSHANIKLRDVCALVVRRMSGAESTMPPRMRVAAVFAELGASPVAKSGWTATAAVRPARDDLSSGLLPAGLLPRILTRAVEDASVCITVSDVRAADQPLVYVNNAFERLTGYAAADILGRNCRFLQRDDRDEAQTAALREAIAAGRSVDALIRNYRADGSLFWNEFHLSPVRNSAARVTHYIGYQLDVTERIEREQQLERLAYRDAATGLLNRAGALRAVDELLDAADEFDVVALRCEQFDDGHAWAENSARLLTMLVAQQLRVLAPAATLARVDATTLVMFGQVPSDDAVRAAFARSADSRDSIPMSAQLGRVHAPDDGLTSINLLARAGQRAADDTAQR